MKDETVARLSAINGQACGQFLNNSLAELKATIDAECEELASRIAAEQWNDVKAHPVMAQADPDTLAEWDAYPEELKRLA